MISDVAVTYALWREKNLESTTGRNLLEAPTSTKTAQATSASSHSPSEEPKQDPNIAQCIRTLELSGIESWETNEHCVDSVAHRDEEEQETEEEKSEHPEEKHEEENNGSESHHNGPHEGEAEQEEHPEHEEHESEEHESDEHEPELKKEEIPESECDEENGPDNFPLLPGANVLGYTYDPDFGLEGCNFDRCVIRPFIKFTYKDCKVVETPAGMFKVPDQIYAHNLYETSAKTHVYENEDEQHKTESVEAHVEGSYGPFSASAHASHNEAHDSHSKQHIAIRKIDVHLYRLNLLNTKSFDSLVPEFKDAFQALPPRFEQNVHEYIQFLRDWGRYVAISGTFGGSVEVIMKFYSASDATKEDMSVGVEMAYSSALISVSGGVNYGKSNEAKHVENNNEISLESSGGDPAIGAMISDIHAPEEMNFRDDLEKWLESLPKYPRLVEDWPFFP